jgi:hypothetical protein
MQPLDAGAPEVKRGGSHIVQLGLRRSEAMFGSPDDEWPRIGPAAKTGAVAAQASQSAAREPVDSRPRPFV